MLQNKNTTIISELNSFFTTSEKAINTIFGILNTIKPIYRISNLPKDIRAKFDSWEVVLLLILFPMLEIKNSFNYAKSPVSQLLNCGKDVFYRLKNNEIINWRSLCYNISFKMIRIAEERGEKNDNANSCLIIDDTDLQKSGWHIELIGRIWSHVSNKSILGFKGLFMGYYDGKSFFCLDFSLHGEKGKNEKKLQGLTKTQLKDRYSKKRNKNSAGFKRTQEYFQAKTETMKTMIRNAAKQRLQFKYILVDSWFTSELLLRFVLSLKKGCHLLAMAKMGKSRYTYNSKELTAKEIIEIQKRKKKVKRSKLLKVWYSSVQVEYKGIIVILFFCKTTHRGKWNVLLTTNTELNFEQAYKIYSTRWTIEVFFKETKQYLDLGKSQSQDFDGQIADTTLCVIQYNILSIVKRFSDYESLGELFRNTKAETLLLSLADKIWSYLIEILSAIAEIFDFDMDLILEKLIEQNQVIIKLLNCKPHQIAT